MAAIGAMVCSTSIESQKSIKSWREAVKYLHSVDRARFLWHSGSVLALKLVALREEMEKVNAGQQQ